MYREHPAPAAGGVLWTRWAAPDERQFWVLPDGCMDLIWSDGVLLVAGPDTGPHLAASRPGTSYAGVRFAPGVGPAVLGVRADELRDQRVRLDALWPEEEVRRLCERIAAAPDPARALERLAALRRQRVDPPDPEVFAIANELRIHRSVATVAARVGFSKRQLHRRCLAAFGYGPKTFARIARLDRALSQARAGRPFAEVAAAVGYADQAHMARDVKALTGTPLGALASPRRQPLPGRSAKRSTELPSGSGSTA